MTCAMRTYLHEDSADVHSRAGMLDQVIHRGEVVEVNGPDDPLHCLV